MSISISDRAVQELTRLGAADGQFLRVSVVPGGCSGMTYSASIDGTMHEGDQQVHEQDKVRVIADAASVPHLDGLSIDYSDDLVQSGFRFKNPNAVKSCGCGASFAI